MGISFSAGAIANECIDHFTYSTSRVISNEGIDGSVSVALIQTMTLADAITATKARTEDNEPTLIYRLGTGNGTNLTPRPIDITGLSYQLSVPTSGDFTITSMEAINATGKLIAINDKPGHVAVLPVDITKMQEWIDSRPNALTNPHEYTELLQSISIRVK